MEDLEHNFKILQKDYLNFKEKTKNIIFKHRDKIKNHQEINDENTESIISIESEIKNIQNNIFELNKNVIELKEEVEENNELYNKIHQRVLKINPYLTQEEQIILEELKIGTLKQDIAKKLKVTNGTITYYYKKLKDKGLIE